MINTKLKKVMGTGLVIATTGLVLTACQGKGAKTSSSSKANHSIALITDSNGVMITHSTKLHGVDSKLMVKNMAYLKVKVDTNTSNQVVLQIMNLTLPKLLMLVTKQFTVLVTCFLIPLKLQLPNILRKTL